MDETEYPKLKCGLVLLQIFARSVFVVCLQMYYNIWMRLIDFNRYLDRVRSWFGAFWAPVPVHVPEVTVQYRPGEEPDAPLAVRACHADR